MRYSAHLHKWFTSFLVFSILTFGVSNILSTDSIVFAANSSQKEQTPFLFPVWEDDPLQDESGLLLVEETEQLNQKLMKLPHPVKIFVLSQLDGDGREFLQQAFSYYELPDNQLVMLLIMDSPRISALAGPQLESYGLTYQLLNEYINTYFIPQAKEKDYVGAFDELITQLFDEVIIPGAMLNPVEEEEPTKETVEKKGLSLWTWILMIFIILIIGLGVYIFIRRSHLQKEAEQLRQFKLELVEQWSKINMNIQLRDVQEEEMLRLESLETTYEDYKYRIFPDLDTDFHDVDLLLSRFRIIAAKDLLNYIDSVLEDAEFLLQQLRKELLMLSSKYSLGDLVMPQVNEDKQPDPQILEVVEDVAVESDLYHNAVDQEEDSSEATIVLQKPFEEKVQEKVNEPVYDEKTITMLRSVKGLVQSVSARYGISLQYIKKQIDQIEKERLLPENLPVIQENLYKLEQGLKRIDQISDEIEEKIPSRLKELEYKFSKVELEDSAALVQIIKECREKWNSLITLWDDGKIHELAAIIDSIHASLSRGEGMIEQEYNQNTRLFKAVEQFEAKWKEVLQIYQQDTKHLEKLKRKYQLDDDPIMDEIKQIEEFGERLEEQYRFVKEKIEHREYKAAYQSASSLVEQLQQLAVAVDNFHVHMQSIATDEEKYSQEIKSLRNRLRIIKQHLDRSLLPGKQEQILILIDQCMHLLLEVEVLFDQLPLRLNKIQLLLKQARDQVESVEMLTTKTIANAKETEEIIRRINIYRTSHPQIAQLLMMAENAYRDSNFDEAVTVARKAEALLQKVH